MNKSLIHFSFVLLLLNVSQHISEPFMSGTHELHVAIITKTHWVKTSVAHTLFFRFPLVDYGLFVGKVQSCITFHV